MIRFVTKFGTLMFVYSEFLQFVLRHYGSALRYGNKYIYQCMPRLLSLWLDFGAKVTEEEGNILIILEATEII